MRKGVGARNVPSVIGKICGRGVKAQGGTAE